MGQEICDNKGHGLDVGKQLSLFSLAQHPGVIPPTAT